MLVLSRKPGEKVHIGQDIVLTVLEVRGSRVRVGIEAPGDTTIARAELNEFWLPELDAVSFAGNS
jgi:carbon storage regulator